MMRINAFPIPYSKRQVSLPNDTVRQQNKPDSSNFQFSNPRVRQFNQYAYHKEQAQFQGHNSEQFSRFDFSKYSKKALGQYMNVMNFSGTSYDTMFGVSVYV